MFNESSSESSELSKPVVTFPSRVSLVPLRVLPGEAQAGNSRPAHLHASENKSEARHVWRRVVIEDDKRWAEDE